MSVRCSQCGKPLVAQYLNLRLGLDEAAVKIVCTCDSAGLSRQLDGAVLMSAIPTWLVSTRFMESTVPPRHVPVDLSSLSCSLETELRFDRTISSRLYSQLSNGHEVTWIERGTSIDVTEHASTFRAKIRQRTGEAWTAKSSISDVVVAPGTILSRSNEWIMPLDAEMECNNSDPHGSWYTSECNARIIKHPEWILRASHYTETGLYAAELEFRSSREIRDDLVCAGLMWLNSMFTCYTGMKSFVDRSLLASVRNASIAVVDVSSDVAMDAVYKVKADGETVWAMDCGYIWLICSPDARLSVIAWFIKKLPLPLTRSWTILRCEQLIDGSLVYIDLLCNNGVAVCPSRRYIRQDTEVLGLKDSPPMILRAEYDTLADASRAIDRDGVPADGVVIIERESRITYRIKEATVDLVVSNGKLVSGRDGKRMVSFEPNHALDEGIVYECTLRRDKIGTHISRIAMRTDKSIPNKYSVVKMTVDRVSGKGDDSALNSGALTVGSYKIRRYLYDWAKNSMSTGRLVVDVGSGRLQSWSVLAANNCTYLFCDPKLDMSIGTLEGRCTDVSNYDSKSMLSILHRMNNGALGHSGFRGRIEDFMSLDGVVRFLTRESIPVVFSFSASHTIDALSRLLRDGARVVGTSFFYDRMLPDGTLVDVPGISMKSTNSAKEARVRMGSEKAYIEQAIVTSDLPRSANIYEASTMVPEVQFVRQPVRDILSHTKIFTSR